MVSIFTLQYVCVQNIKMLGKEESHITRQTDLVAVFRVRSGSHPQLCLIGWLVVAWSTLKAAVLNRRTRVELWAEGKAADIWDVSVSCHTLVICYCDDKHVQFPSYTTETGRSLPGLFCPLPVWVPAGFMLQSLVGWLNLGRLVDSRPLSHCMHHTFDEQFKSFWC